MTEERFEDLVNLYLDNEIGRHELDELKRSLEDNVLRQRQFERACQLHQAARKALVGQQRQSDRSPAGRPRPAGGAQSSRRSGSSANGNSGSPKESQRQAMVNATVPSLFDRQNAQGAAASVSLHTSSHRHRSKTGGDRTLSGVSMKTWLVLGAVFFGGAGWFLLNFPTSNQDDRSDYEPNSRALYVPMTDVERGRIFQTALPGVISDGNWQPVNPDESIRARMYAATVTGNSVSRTMQINLMTSQPDAAGDAGNGPPASSPFRSPERLFVRSVTITMDMPDPAAMARAMPIPQLRSGNLSEPPALPPSAASIQTEDNSQTDSEVLRFLQP